MNNAVFKRSKMDTMKNYLAAFETYLDNSEMPAWKRWAAFWAAASVPVIPGLFIFAGLCQVWQMIFGHYAGDAFAILMMGVH